MSDTPKILVVDDEPAICESIKELLEMNGNTVYSADNGVAGLKICAQVPIDLIVLDISMPRMDGYMFMEHLKERWDADKRRFKFPHILVLSAVDHQSDLGLAKSLGATQFMNKPFNSKDFIAMVNRILG